MRDNKRKFIGKQQLICRYEIINDQPKPLYSDFCSNELVSQQIFNNVNRVFEVKKLQADGRVFKILTIF